MQAIFTRNGRVASWLNSDQIIGLDGQHVAFVEKFVIYNYLGHCLGKFSNGYFIAKDGKCVGFIKGATGVPLLPIPAIIPIPPIPQINIAKPITRLSDQVASSSLYWSNISFEDFIVTHY